MAGGGLQDDMCGRLIVVILLIIVYFPFIFSIIITIKNIIRYYKNSNIFNQINIIINIIILLLIIFMNELDVCAKAYGFNGIIKIYVICVIFSFIIDLYNFEFSYFNIVENLCLLYFTLFFNDYLKKKRECVKKRNNLKNNKK